MSAPVSEIFAHSYAAQSDVNRRSANFHPSIWGDQFLSYAPSFMETTHNQEHQRLKDEVKMMLMAGGDSLIKKLRLIDAIQRLGISYHFETEINEILRDIHNSSRDDEDDNNNDFYYISLKFRLLRQQGYKMSCDVFTMFKCGDGNFKQSITNDPLAMLSFYEATHLRVHGEDILDEALAFTTTQLESMAADASSSLAAQIAHALKQPIRKGLPRLEARQFFSFYKEDFSYNQALLNFAKLDFNILQKMHQKELSDIAKWWKDLDFKEKLPFARDRVVECYFCILGVYFEPEYALARRMLTKVTAMTSVIDDIYDVHGTPDELELFTAAIQRWDINALDMLPYYMQECYKALLDIYEEIEKNMNRQTRNYCFLYAKEAMMNQVKAYFLESKWFHQGYLPTMEEYMPLALVTSAYGMLATVSFVGMGDIVTKDSFDWLLSEPKILTALATIGRLMDDIMSYKFEQKRGHVASSIECYMKQHGGTEEEATHELQKQVINAWKDVNEGCLYPTNVPIPLLTRILNLARAVNVLYKNEDGYTNASAVMKDFVSSLLIEPVMM